MNLFGYAIIVLLPMAIFIIGCVKGTMKWVSFLFNLTIFLYGLVVGLTIIYAMPEGPVIIGGRSNLWIPFTLSALALIAAVLSLLLKSRVPAGSTSKAAPVRWVFLIAGLLISLGGQILSYSYIYIPDLAQENWGHMQSAVVVSIATSFVGLVLVYLGSRFNSAAKPNLMRWLASGFAYFLLGNFPMSVALILIYAAPVKPPTIFPDLSCLQMLAYLPYIFLFTMLAKDYQKPAVATAEPPQALQTDQAPPQPETAGAQT
jgi:hypothetical protein